MCVCVLLFAFNRCWNNSPVNSQSSRRLVTPFVRSVSVVMRKSLSIARFAVPKPKKSWNVVWRWVTAPFGQCLVKVNRIVCIQTCIDLSVHVKISVAVHVQCASLCIELPVLIRAISFFHSRQNRFANTNWDVTISRNRAISVSVSKNILIWASSMIRRSVSMVLTSTLCWVVQVSM